MKYTFLIPLFFLSNMLMYGQSGIPLKLFIYPNISQPVYKTDGSVPNAVSDLFKDLEIPKVSYSIGGQAGLSLNEKWSLFSGANYMMTGYKDKKRKIQPREFEPDIPNSIKAKYNIVQIEIPIQAKRLFLKKEKINYYVMAGPSIWFNISHNKITTSTYSDGRIETEKTADASTDFKAVNLAASFGLGIEWAANEKFGFYIQPTSQMGFLGMALDEPLNRDIFNFGVAAGVILK